MISELKNKLYSKRDDVHFKPMLNEMIAEYWREDEQGEQHVNQVKNKTSEGICSSHNGFGK